MDESIPLADRSKWERPEPDQEYTVRVLIEADDRSVAVDDVRRDAEPRRHRNSFGPGCTSAGASEAARAGRLPANALGGSTYWLQAERGLCHTPAFEVAGQ